MRFKVMYVKLPVASMATLFTKEVFAGEDLFFTYGEMRESMIDGAGISTFLDRIICKKYDLKYLGRNNPGYDGESKDGKRISIRTLSENGVKFQCSSLIGCKRSATQEDLISLWTKVDVFLIADIRDPNRIKVTPIDIKKLTPMFKKGLIKTYGIKATDFYKLLG